MSRCMSAFLSFSRLSCNLRPLHKPSSTLARPSLKYILSGTSVSPCSKARLANFLTSRRCMSSLRGRLGLWLNWLACTYSAISSEAFAVELGLTVEQLDKRVGALFDRLLEGLRP